MPDDNNLSFTCSDFEVAYFRATGIRSAFIPAINDSLEFPADSPKGKRNRALIRLVTAVTFNIYLFVLHVDLAFDSPESFGRKIHKRI